MTRQQTLRQSPWHDPRLTWVGVLAVEASLLLGYFSVTTTDPTTEIRYLVYPFVWINAGLWAVSRATPRPTTRSHKVAASLAAVGYVLVLLWIPGQLRLGTLGGNHVGLHHLRIAWAAPGWGPVVAYDGVVRFFLVPFEVIGYGSLGYLLYATLLDTTRGAVSGVFGLVTCVGCTAPVLVPLVGLLGGPATGLTTTAYAWSYDIGTMVFLVTLGVLYLSHRRTRSSSGSPTGLEDLDGDDS